MHELTTRLAQGGELIQVSLPCQVVQLRTLRARNGNPYIELEFTDGTASQRVRVWHDHPAYPECRELEEGGFIFLQGVLRRTPWGLSGEELKVRPLTPDEVEELLAGPPDRHVFQEKAYQKVVEFIGKVTDPRLRKLGLSFLEEHGAQFRRAPAAREYHHAYRGGLLEHVAQMLEAASALEPVYPNVNWDLVRVGILFHDSGKLWEHSCGARTLASHSTRVGELLGHIPIGIELVNRLWRDLSHSPEFSLPGEPPAEDVRQHLLHLIASHHGQREFGSPVTPKTPEAWVLHYLDNLDAKLAMLKAAYEETVADLRGIYERRPPLEGRPVEPLPRYRST